MIHECPNCREVASYWRIFRTPAWGSFRCNACGSVLTISMGRRIVAGLIWIALALLAMEGLGLHRTPRLILYPLMLASLVALLYLCEKIVLLERRAFTCRKCGYDLEGLVEPRCPECGSEFDPAQRERILARIRAPSPRPRRRVLAAIAIVLVALSVAGGFVLYRSAARVPAPLPATTSEPVG